MNSNQHANLSSSVDSLCEALNGAWSYFHLMQGLHEEGRKNPEALRRFGWFFDRTWTAIYESFFAKVGTLLDGTKGVHSLPNLVSMARRYLDSEKVALLPKIEQEVSNPDGPFCKFKSWRHEVVAHRTDAGRAQQFYVDNKMNLPEVGQALLQLERLLNQVSVLALSLHTDVRSGSEGLVAEGRTLLECITSTPKVSQSEGSK